MIKKYRCPIFGPKGPDIDMGYLIEELKVVVYIDKGSFTGWSTSVLLNEWHDTPAGAVQGQKDDAERRYKSRIAELDVLAAKISAQVGGGKDA